ncbi:MAG: chorismate-binding protein [Bacteroidales bacterium]|nr:chorismate-binding protein [Bacteroidales bacterium]
MSQVNEIKQEIKKKSIKKAVLSRIHIEPKHSTCDETQVFLELCKKYPNAFVYIFQMPNAGCWIGATPEPLLEIQDNVAETISLAATQKTGKSPELIHWPEKEMEEQSIVTGYIEDILCDFGIKKFNKIGPFSYKAGNIVHLKTRFIFDAEKLNQRIGDFAEALHPTPSVCGLPKMRAFELIDKIESHQREYYTGILGPVNMDKQTALYVNLRCMKVLTDKFALYAGVGITSGSIPESEWEETNQKKMTLLSVIDKLNKTG